MKLKPYPSYKDSRVAWLGDVPENWGTHRLRWMFQRKKETNRPDAELLSVYRDYGVIPKSSRDDNFNKPSDDLSAYQFVERGDLVLNKMKTWQGSIAISDHEGIVSPAYYVAKPLLQMNLKFMHYLLRSPVYISQYNLLSAGIRPNQWDLDFDDFRDLLALLPSKEEQPVIATFLDRETTKLDTLISKQEKLIELLQEKRQAVISHAVTKGLDPDAPMKDSGVEWLGEVPKGWNACRFSRAILAIKDGTHGTFSRVDEGKLLLSAKNVNNGIIEISDDESLITIEDHESIVYNGFPKKGDLLLTIVGTIGRSCVYQLDDSISFQRSVCFIRLKKSCLPQFFYYFTQSKFYQEQLHSKSKSSAQAGVYMGDVVATSVVYPIDYKEQSAITTFLDRETNKIETLIEKAKRSIELAKEHRTALISAAVTGKIDVREYSC
ncbi:MAG: restriction endonuclease subunit S [Methylotenera sp.]|nr:restriction endonuclease subunit S [Methylotenera sp.]MDP1958612.1 restriction endonuclease subunit S [Methylotenera sp.]MDP3943768.1 restriction endonuclease subunit S [Methylotenera sp.]